MVDSADSRWVDAPNAWVKNIPSSRRRGKAGEMLVESWLSRAGIPVGRPKSSDADRNVAGFESEVKLSTEWENGEFRFQQLRDQEYSIVFLVGVRPGSISIWVVPKAVILEHAVPQHGGVDGVDTHWLCFDASNTPTWLVPYGGTPAQAEMVLRTMLPASPVN
jgi:hypothetical protein